MGKSASRALLIVMAAGLSASACRAAAPGYVDGIADWPQKTALYLGYLEAGDGLYRDPPFPNSGTFLDTTRTAALLAQGDFYTDSEATAAWFGRYQNASGLFSDPSGALVDLESTRYAVEALMAMNVEIPNRVALIRRLNGLVEEILNRRGADDGGEALTPLPSLRYALESLRLAGGRVDDAARARVREFVIDQAKGAELATGIEKLLPLTAAVGALQAIDADEPPLRASLAKSLAGLEGDLAADSLGGVGGVGILLFYEEAAHVLGAGYVSLVPADVSARASDALRDCPSLEAEFQMPVSWGPLTVAIYLSGLKARDAPAVSCLEGLELADGSYGALGSRESTPLTTDLARTTLRLLAASPEYHANSLFCPQLDGLSPRELLAVARLLPEGEEQCRDEVTRRAIQYMESRQSLSGLQYAVETLAILSALDSATVEMAGDTLKTLISEVTCADLSREEAAFVARSTTRFKALIGTPTSCVQEAAAALAHPGNADVPISSAYDVLVSSPRILNEREQREILARAVTAQQQPIGGVVAPGSSEIDLFATCQAAFVRNALISGELPSVACD